jgi:hypothetical protein
MENLISFGCSITYGQWLSNPSDAWPIKLGNYLNKNPINLGVPGASNLEILYNILNYNFSNTDTVIVMWSNPDRDLIYSEDENVRIGSWQESELVKHWMLTHSEYDIANRSWLYFHHAKLFFESKKIKYYFFSIDIAYCNTFKPSYLDVDLFDVDVVTLRKADVANDGSHPGPVSHELIAKEILKFIC